MWIRGPIWDGFWLLGPLPFGAALTILSGWVPAEWIVFWLIVVTQTAHLLSPIALAWTHRDFRDHMLRHKVKFIVFPIAIVIASAAAAYIGGKALHIEYNPMHFALGTDVPITLETWANPLMALVLTYALWNGWHFGRQTFGVASIYRRKAGASGGRRIDLVYFCGVTWAAMLMPFVPRLMQALHDWTGLLSRGDVDYVRPVYFALALALIPAMLWREWHTTRSLPRAALILTDGLGLVLVWYAGLWGFAIIGLNHWLVAIGLASHVHGNERRAEPIWFALALIVLGLIAFAALFVRWPPPQVIAMTVFGPRIIPMPMLEPERWLSFTTTAVGLRLGLGFAHFLYDRWLYKMSNPAVRATIGSNLFPVPERRRIDPFPAMAD